jgi:hypothetical protein
MAEASTLREKLDALGEEVMVREVPWSGRNSHAARLEAAAKIRAAIHRVQADSRTASAAHFIIAHSHGGNAALYALRDLEEKGSITGLVCLSTPFIYARQRKGGEDPLTVAVFGAVCLTAVATLMATAGRDGATAFVAQVRQTHVAWWHAGLAILTISFVAGLAFALHQLADRIAKKRVVELSLPSLDEIDVLVLQSPADEAHGWLKSSQFAGWIATRANRSLATAAEFLFKRWPLFVGGPAVLILLWAAFLPDSLNPFSDQLIESLVTRDALIYGYMAVGAAVIAACVLAATVAGIAVAAASWYGLSLGILTSHLELSAEANPPGRHETYQLTFPVSEKGGLQHSAIYNDSAACEAIVDWVRRSAEASRSGNRMSVL